MSSIESIRKSRDRSNRALVAALAKEANINSLSRSVFSIAGVSAIWGVQCCIYPLCAQTTDSASELASRAPIVVLGTVEKVASSEEPLLPATDATVIIKIEHMYAGAEIAGDLAGQTATIILSRAAAMPAGARAIFYGSPRFIGKTVTIADLGETPSPPGASLNTENVVAAAQVRRDIPLRARLDLADAVFIGTVQSIAALDQESKSKQQKLVDEHDPQLRIAMVRVKSSVRSAKAGALVSVAFATSCDIMWCGSPKLSLGQEAVFIAHYPRAEEPAIVRASPRESALLEKARVLLVTSPFDVLRTSEIQHVQGLLRAKEGR